MPSSESGKRKALDNIRRQIDQEHAGSGDGRYVRNTTQRRLLVNNALDKGVTSEEISRVIRRRSAQHTIAGVILSGSRDLIARAGTIMSAKAARLTRPQIADAVRRGVSQLDTKDLDSSRIRVGRQQAARNVGLEHDRKKRKSD